MSTDTDEEKPLEWIGSSKKDLLGMPEDVQDVFGFALSVAQFGGTNDDVKVLKGFGGADVLEVVESHEGNAYRAVYTVRFKEAVYVLHCFQKKSHSGISTPLPDIEVIRLRLKAARTHYDTHYVSKRKST
jgi:phage-related protein